MHGVEGVAAGCFSWQSTMNFPRLNGNKTTNDSVEMYLGIKSMRKSMYTIS
jgi:hypothetical protein